jgi:hypothetical protein
LSIQPREQEDPTIPQFEGTYPDDLAVDWQPGTAQSTVAAASSMIMVRSTSNLLDIQRMRPNLHMAAESADNPALLNCR